jgi:RNA polymerase sigma-70 factor (ECF subfamily)
MDRESFGELVRRHQPGVSRFVARYLRSREDGDEVVQETFLRAWAQIGRFQPGTNFSAWILTIARFLCLARLKDAQRHPPPASMDAATEPPSPPLPENLERLKRACEKLPLPQREVVAMRFFDELDYRSIAEITGATEVALRSRLHDALERLKEILKTES